MSPGSSERPGRRNSEALNVTAGDMFSVQRTADALEQRRRARLVKSLHRVADRLDRTDRDAAALARHWAREVA